MDRQFRVGITRDLLAPDGTLGAFDSGLNTLWETPGVQRGLLAESVSELTADLVRGYNALLVGGARVTGRTLEGADSLVLVARLGVGYDNVDVRACTEHGVMLTITPDGVRRPMATTFLTFILALSHKLLIKDRLTRSGRWGERLNHMGMGLVGRVLGLVGVGNIGRELLEIARPLGMKYLAYDPYVRPEDVADLGVEMVDLEGLLRTADFVCIACPYTAQTHHLIDAERLALMKPTAYLINAARGPIVDQKALADVLRAERIQGAALDVFEREPVDPEDPILKLDNVIVSPHSLSWTDQGFLDIGRSAAESVQTVASGRIPRYVVNRDVLDSPLLQSKLSLVKAAGS